LVRAIRPGLAADFEEAPMSQNTQTSTPGSENYYVARPKSGQGKGVLVLHAWWGLNQFCRDFCDRLAQEGFVALAPDLYHGATATTIEEAKKLRAKLKQETVAKEITQTAEHLRATCGVSPASAGGLTCRPGIGVVGFSLGGYWALWLADQKASPVVATVVFYGSRHGDYTASPSAFQFHLAETDDYVAASGVKKMQKSLQAAGKEAEFYTYAGTTHWFFESDRADAYNAPAAELAWRRTVEFLQKHLRET
jgi:carboxymethylenebutenolidase